MLLSHLSNTSTLSALPPACTPPFIFPKSASLSFLTLTSFKLILKKRRRKWKKKPHLAANMPPAGFPTEREVTLQAAGRLPCRPEGSCLLYWNATLTIVCFLWGTIDIVWMQDPWHTLFLVSVGPLSRPAGGRRIWILPPILPYHSLPSPQLYLAPSPFSKRPHQHIQFSTDFVSFLISHTRWQFILWSCQKKFSREFQEVTWMCLQISTHTGTSLKCQLITVFEQILISSWADFKFAIISQGNSLCLEDLFFLNLTCFLFILKTDHCLNNLFLFPLLIAWLRYNRTIKVTHLECTVWQDLVKVHTVV